MSAAEKWNLVLAAIAAITGIAAVGFWVIDTLRRRREEPIAQIILTSVKPMKPRYAPRPGLEYGMLSFVNSGDADARSVEIEVRESSFRIEDGHLDLNFSTLAAGETKMVPVSWRSGTRASGRIVWAWGPGKALKADGYEISFGMKDDGSRGAV